MISLTYLSTAQEAFSDDELAGLLSYSRERNHAADLTGALLYSAGHFIQTLEGPEEAVDATFERIKSDQRHRSVLVALREPIESRVFPDWSMAFQALENEDSAQLPGFNDYLSQGRVSGDDAVQLGRPGVFHRIFRDNIR